MILAKLKVAATAGVIALSGAGLTVGGLAYTTAQVPAAPATDGEKPAKVTPTPPNLDAPRRITLAQIGRSRANLEKLTKGMHRYSDTFDRLPNNIVSDKTELPLLSWRVAILPYIGEEELYKEFNLDQPWDSVHNLKLLSKMPDCLRVGFEAEGSTDTYYQVFHAPGAAMFPVDQGGAPKVPGATKVVPKITEIFDGTSNTIGIVECGPAVPWSKPADIAVSDLSKPLPQLQWPFKQAIMVALLDGTAHVFARTMTDSHLRAMITSHGGELYDDDVSKMFRVRLPATTAEEKVMLEKARAKLALTAAAARTALDENLRLLTRDANDDLYDLDETTRRLKEMVDNFDAENKALAAPKK